MLRRRGFGAAAEKADSLSMSRFFSLDLSETCLVWICYVEPPSPKFNTLFADWVKRTLAGTSSSTISQTTLESKGQNLVGIPRP
jgi:hypothetical protein